MESHAFPVRRRAISEKACSITAVVLLGVLDSVFGEHSADDDWRGVFPSVKGNSTLGESATRSSYDVYFDFITISTVIALSSAVCGITICLFCKTMPESEPTCNTTHFKYCPLVEEGLKYMCCPDPVVVMTDDEQRLLERKEMMNSMLKKMDNQEDIQVGGNMSSFRIDSSSLVTKLSKKKLLP